MSRGYLPGSGLGALAGLVLAMWAVVLIVAVLAIAIVASLVRFAILAPVYCWEHRHGQPFGRQRPAVVSRHGTQGPRDWQPPGSLTEFYSHDSGRREV